MKLDRLFALTVVVAVGLCLAIPLNCVAAEHAPAEHGDTGHSAADQGGESNPLVVDIDLAIWTAVVFAVLLFLLNRYAWPVISTALVEREQRIEDTLAAAQARHDEAKQLLAEHEARLASAAGDVRALLEEARRDAEHTKEQIIAEAKQASDQERDRAIRDVERATNQAMKNLAETSANLAVDLAGKVVRQNITAEQQAELVRDALGSLSAIGPSKN